MMADDTMRHVHAARTGIDDHYHWPPEPSVAQQWARERNWNKLRMCGIRQSLINMSSDHSTPPEEHADIKAIYANVLLLLEHWKGRNQSSKEFYKQQKELGR